MSVSPTEDALIVALDFQGELEFSHFGEHNLEFHTQQASTTPSVQWRRTCLSSFSALLFQIS